MLLAPAIVLLALCLVTVTGELPSSCLTSLTTSHSVQCCRAQPFLEVSFKLRFGCDVPHHLDEGIRLEIMVPDGDWQPVRFYTPSLVASNVSIVRVNEDNITVEAEALLYTSVFPLEVMEGNQTLLIHEYICDDSLLSSSVSIRWMQRYNETSVQDVSTWSLDDVEIIFWNGECRHEVLNLTFDDNTTISGEDKYQILAGNVEIPPCDLTGNRQLYFHEEANNRVTARRSITIRNLPIATSLINCSTSTVYDDGLCDVEECSSGNNVCSIGTLQCTDCIGVGYQLPANSSVGSCLDINECEGNRNSCEQQCVNSPGSYYCDCDSGYTLSSDNITCLDIDECKDSSKDCEQLCINTPGSFECSCSSGYSLLANGINCEDVNECNEPARCDQVCLNTNGSFQCDCRGGFTLADDMHTCQDIDECLVLQHGCQHMCTNTVGSYHCSCFHGFQLSSDGLTCTDIDECEDSSTCSQLCTNTNGSYQCDCREGFTLLPNGVTCQDIDECASSMNDCEDVCINVPGSYQCNCSIGFTLSSDRSSCLDIDECELSLHNCMQICINMPGSYQCNCSLGFVLSSDDYSCQDINECESLNGCQDQCNNTIGSFVCTCNKGYQLSSDGQTCTDINECVDSSPCSQLCTNTNGSYQCDCREGFTLLPNGATCQLEIQRDKPQDVAFRNLLDLRARLSAGGLSNTELAKILSDLVLDLIEAGVTAPRNLSVLFSEIVDVALTTADTKGEMIQASVSSIFNSLDMFALKVYDDSEPMLATKGFELQVMSAQNSSDRIEGIRQGVNQITLPALENGAKIASFYFKDLSSALPENPPGETGDNGLEMIPVISSSVFCDSCDVSNLEEPVQYRLSFDNTGERDPRCFFYNLTLHGWSSDGCEVNKDLTNSSVVVCECTHLTHFAILLSPNANFSEADSLQLRIITYVGVSVSLFFLLLTIFLLSLLKSLRGMRNFIHVNLCISLFIAQLIFVVAVDKSHDDILCQSVAIVLHYVFLVTFMWMLMEGVVLYVALVQVFVKKQRLYMLAFTLVSYGVPLVYLAIVVPLGLVLRGSDGRPHYGYEVCWLRYDTGFIWAFIAPVILIIMVNVGFFIMAVYIMRKHTKRQTQNSHLKSVSQWLKSSVLLVVSMGIPWITGVIIFTSELVFLAYIYTIFIAFQGLLIFILFVVFSKQVREGYRKWWRSKVSQSEFLSKHFSSSDMDRKSGFLGRFSSMKTSTLRLSRHDRNTLTSSHAEDNDIKLPHSPSEKKSLSPSQSPPPAYEQYIVVSQKVVTVGNGSVDPEKHTKVGNGSIYADQNGSALNGQTKLSNSVISDRESMAEVQTMKFSDSVSNINDCRIEGTSL